MIDQAQRLDAIVKDELAKAAVSLGIDKSQVGFYVSPTFAPLSQADGQVGISFAWVVVVSLRIPLLGYPAIAIPVTIPTPPGVMPPDEAFRGSAKMGLENANTTYRQILDGEASGKGLGKFAA